ncbi:MAG: hypothetical protein ACOY0S_04390 [Patescibacteria group bacterium]
MTTIINELVSVNLLGKPGKVYPAILFWRGRRYAITKVGLHHTVKEGRTLFHIFSVTDGNTYFKLQLDTETLSWKLLEVDG